MQPTGNPTPPPSRPSSALDRSNANALGNQLDQTKSSSLKPPKPLPAIKSSLPTNFHPANPVHFRSIRRSSLERDGEGNLAGEMANLSSEMQNKHSSDGQTDAEQYLPMTISSEDIFGLDLEVNRINKRATPKSITPDPITERKKGGHLPPRSLTPSELPGSTLNTDRPRKGLSHSSSRLTINSAFSTLPKPSIRDVSYLTGEKTPLEDAGPSIIPADDYVYEKIDPFTEYDPADTFTGDDGQRYVRVFPSRKPTGRAEAIHLANWFDKKMSKLAKTGESFEESAELDALLTRAIDEVIRQVSVQCVERGMILKRACTIQKQLCSRLLRINSNLEKTKTDQEKHILEMNSMKESLEAQIENLVSNLDGKNKELQLSESLIRRNEMEYLKKQVTLRNEVDYLQKRQKEIVKECDELILNEKRRLEVEAEIAVEEVESKMEDLVDELNITKRAHNKLLQEKGLLEKQFFDLQLLKEQLEQTIPDLLTDDHTPLERKTLQKRIEDLFHKSSSQLQIFMNQQNADPDATSSTTCDVQKDLEEGSKQKQATESAAKPPANLVKRPSFSEFSKVVVIHERQRQRKLLESCAAKWKNYVSAVKAGRIYPLKSTQQQTEQRTYADVSVEVCDKDLSDEFGIKEYPEREQKCHDDEAIDQTPETGVGPKFGRFLYGKMAIHVGRKRLSRSHSDPDIYCCGSNYIMDHPKVVDDLRGSLDTSYSQANMKMSHQSTQTWRKLDTKCVQTSSKQTTNSETQHISLLNSRDTQTSSSEPRSVEVQTDTDAIFLQMHLSAQSQESEPSRPSESILTNREIIICKIYESKAIGTEDLHSGSSPKSPEMLFQVSPLVSKTHPQYVGIQSILNSRHPNSRLETHSSEDDNAGISESNSETRPHSRISNETVSTKPPPHTSIAQRFRGIRAQKTPEMDEIYVEDEDSFEGISNIESASMAASTQGISMKLRPRPRSVTPDAGVNYENPNQGLLTEKQKVAMALGDGGNLGLEERDGKRDGKSRSMVSDLRSLLKDQRKMGSVVVQLSLRKLIFQIMEERIRVTKFEAQSNTVPAAEFVNTFVSKRYGLQSIAQKHLRNLVQSMEHFQDKDLLVHLFSRFCGLHEGIPLDAFNFTTSFLYLLQANGALSALPQLQRDAQYISLARIDHVVNLHFLRVFPSYPNTNILKKIRECGNIIDEQATHVHIDYLVCAAVEYWYENSTSVTDHDVHFQTPENFYDDSPPRVDKDETNNPSAAQSTSLDNDSKVHPSPEEVIERPLSGFWKPPQWESPPHH